MPELRTRNIQYAIFEVSDTNTAALLLEQHFNRVNYTLHDGNIIRVYDGIEQRAKINSCFVSNGLSVATVSVSNENLEDYFSKLIGGGGIA